ncbi:uncharacterized protein LOC129975104 [Argiope bruennichi]|uniref:uncharacterized protein LOC129975104 n=1 Tax=Argiope bruennichi TaxID=94029 RepID=UPI002495824C|nr:uncharacterized protein LOC129975104 [Argiope bruennichi]
MNWLTTLGFAVLLLSLQCNGVQSRKHSSNLSRSPWADSAKAKAFMDCLIKKIEQSDVLPQKEKEDMEMLVQSLMSALSGHKGNNSEATLKAMNMAFASALAELVVAEDADDPDSIATKTEALSKALQQCFKKTMHKVNRKFIAEIKDLIQMFVKEAAEDMNDTDEDNEFQEDYTSNMEFQTSDLAAKDTFITNYQTDQGYATDQYPTEGQFGPSDTSSGAGLTPDRLTNTLSRSRVLVSVFGGLRSPYQVRDVLKEAVKGILTDLLRVDVNSASRLADVSTSFAVRLPIGSSPGDYVRPLVQQLYPRLQSFFAKPGASNLFFKLLLTGLTNKASQYGVVIPKDAADNDIVSLSANLGSIPSVPTSVGADISLGDTAGQYPEGGQFGPADSPSDSTSGAGLTPDRLTDALSGSRVIVSVLGGLRSPYQVRDVLKEAVKGILTDLLRVDVNSASRLADISTSFAVRLPIGSSSGEYVRPLVQQLYPRLQSFFAKPGSSNLFFKLLLTGITNKAAQYGVMIPKDAADNDIVSLSANLGSIPSVPTSVGADISLGDSGGQYPDGGQFGPAGSPSDSSSGAGLTPDRLTDALSGSRVLVSVFGGLRSPNQVRDVLKEAVKGILTDLLRVDVNSASRLADISTSFAVRLPIGSSSGEYVRPLVQQLYPRLQSFFAKPGASNLFFKLLLTGITNKAAQYGVMIPKDAADNDIVSLSANLGSIPSVPTSVGADISLGDSGGQYPDGGQFGPAGSPSDSSSGAGLTPDRLTDALSGSRVLVSVFGGLRSPNQVRDVLKEAVKGILTDLLRVDVNSASRLADISTSFAVRLPIGSSSGEYVRPLVQQLYPRLQSFFAKPGASNLFFKLLLTGITNKAAQYGVMIPKDAADNDIVSLSANLGSIPSVPTSVGADISLGDSGGQYPDGGQFGPAGSPSDSSSGAGLTPDRLTDALSGSRVLVSVFGGLRSPNQVRDVLKEAVKGILTDLLRVDVNSASRLADISTSFAVRLPIGSSSGEYVRPLVQQLYPRLQSFFAKPGASNLFFKLLLTGITNKAAQYGVMIPKDAADNDIVSLSANLGSIPSVPTSVGADISLGDSGGQYPDGGQFGPAGSPSDSSSGAGLTPDRLTDALSGSRVLVSVFGGLRSPNQVRDVLKEAVKGILTDLLRVDVNSASRLADISTSFAVRLPIGSSSGEYVRPLVQQLYPRLQSFFAKPGASNLFFKLLLTGITNKAAQYGVMIPKDAADNDIVSLSANLGSIPSVPTSVGADISLGDSGGQYPDGGQFGPAGSPSDSSSGAGLTPDRLTDALSGSRVLVSVFGGLRSPNQVRDVLKEAVKGILTDLLRVDVNSASRLADISTSFAVRLPIGSSSGEYVRPLVQQLYPRLQSFFAKPGASNLFFKLLLTGITNKAAQYGVMIPKDAADNDIVSLSANLGSIPSVPTSVGADISLGDSGGQYPDGGQFGPAGSPSDSSSGAGLTPDRLTDALSGSRVLVSVFGGLRSPNQVRDVLKEAVKGILTDLLRVDVNSASRLADISTSFAVRLPIGSSSGEYVRPLVQQLYPRLQSFFAKPGASNLFFKLLLTGITNKAAQYGVMIPKDAADNDIVSLSANLGSIPSVPTSVGTDISLGDSGGQYPDGGQFGPAGSPSDSSSGAGLTPDRLTDALSGSRVLVSVFGGLRSPNQVRDVLKEAVKGILTDLLRVDVNSASRLADISTSFAVRLPIGSSSGEYVRPLVQQLYPRLQSFFAKPGASNLFFKLLLTGITNKAAQYGVMIPKDAVDNDIVSLSANLGSIPSVPTSVGADISLGDSGGQYPDGGQFGPAGSPSDSSSGAGLTPDRLTDALSGSRVLVSVFGGLRSPNQVRDVLKEAVKGILTDLLRVDVNSASRLADISTSFAVRLPIGSSSGEYVRPLVQQLYPRLQSFFAKPGASNLFFNLLLTGITNKAAQYGVMIPKDAADNDIVSLSANLGSIPSVPTSVGADISLGDSGGQYPDGGQFGPAGSPSDSSSGAGLTPDRLTDALSGSRVLVSVFGGLRSPNQVRDVLKEAVKGILTDLLRVDVNSASRLADISTSFAVRLPIGSSSGEYVRPLVQQLYPRLQSFFAKPGASNLFFKLLLTGITNKAAQYGVMIPKDAADNDIVSLSANLGSIPSVPTSVGADISLGDSGGQYPDGGQFGPAGSPSDSSSGAGLTPDRLTDALSGSRVLVSVFGGLRSPNQVRDVLKEAVKGILTDLLRVDVNSASRLADISTSFAVRLPIGSSSGEYVRPLVQQLYPRLQSFFAKPGASNLFFKLLLTGITNKAAQYGVMIPKDAADNDIVSLSANLGSIPSVPTSVGADISLGDSGGQYPDGGQFGPAGSPSDSSSGAGLTPDRLTDALSGSRVLVSVFGGLRSPNQVRDVLKEAVKGILTDLLRVDVNSASRLADISTSFAVRLPIGSSSGEYVRPLVQQLYPRLQSFFAKPGASNLFFKLLLTGITNKAAQYGVMIPKDAADNDIVSLSANLGSIPSVPTSVGADISLGDSGGQYPDGGQFGPAGSPSDSSSGAGLTPDRLTDALSGSRVLVSVFGGLRSPNQVRDVLKEAVKGILTDLLRVDVNSASRLADISTSFAVRLPIGSSSGEYVRPLVQQLYPRLQSFFAKPGASNLFFKLLLTGITNKAAQYGVMIPKDAADNDIVSLSANLGSIPSVPTSVGADISLGDSGGQYPDGGQFGPAGSPSDSSSGAGLTPDRLTDALSGSRVLVSVFGGLRSPNQVRDVLKEAVKGILTDLLRVDVNSASRLADISTSFAVRLPIGSSSGEYVRPLVQQLYPRLQSFFAKPGASNLFFKLLLTGITNKAAQYGVMIPKDAADNDIVSLSANLGSIPSVPTSVGTDISLGDSGGQYPDGGQFGPAGSPSDSSSGAGLTPDRLTDALSGSRVLVSVFGGLRSPNQVRDVLKEAVKGILTDLLRVDVNSASRLADISTSFAVRLPIGSSSGEYVRPLVQQLYPRLQSFFAKPGASNLFFKLLLTGITNKAAQYGVMIPKDAADNDIVSLSANLGSIPSVPTSVGADISLGDSGGQYPDGGQFGPAGSPSVSSSGAGLTPDRLTDALSGSRVLVSVFGGLRSPNQVRDVLKEAVKGILTDLLRVDVNSASRLADISTSFAVRLPIGSSSGEYVRPLVQQLYPRLQSFFAKPGASNLFFKLLLTGITNKAAQYGVMIPKDAADNDIVSLSANLGSIPSVPTSVGADISLGDSGGQYPDGGQFGPAGSPSDSSSGAGLTPDRLTDALSGSRVLVSVFGGLRSPNQVRDVLKEAVKGILTDLLRVDVNSASRLADISTSFAVRLPIGSSSGEYVRPLVQQLYPRLQSFFAKPGASNLFFKLLLTGITNKAAQYGVMIPKDAADNDIVSLSANLGSIPSVPTSVGADISLGDSGGQYPDGGQFGPAGSPSDSSSGAGLTPDRLTDALSGSRVLVSVFGGLRSPNQVRDVLKEAVKGILTDLLRVDVNSASRLADISTSFAVRLPIGSSSGEYVRPLVQQLYPRLQSFFAKPGASNLFFKLLLTGITNKAAQYGVMIPKDAADNDIVSLSANLGSIPSVPTSVGADISLGDTGGQYPDGGQFGPAGSPSDSSSGAGLTPDRLTDALSGSRVLVSVFGGLRSPNQVRDVLKEAVKGILTDLLRVDVNSASRLADISTSFAVRLPIGSSSGEYVRPLVQQLYPRLQSFFAKPGASNLFFKLLLTGITNKAAQYGVMIPKDAADNDIVSLSANLGSIPSVPTSVGADISLGDSGGQYPDGGQFGPAGSPSDSSSGAGLTPDRLTDALSGSRVLVSVFGGLRSPNQVRDVLKEAVKGILTDLLRVDVNSASRLADISTSFAVRLPIGSSSGEYVRPLVQQLYPRLQSFFAKPGASNLFFKLLLTGITNKAAQYGVMIPKDAADNDIVSLSANLGSIPSVPTSVGADISLGDSGGQYPDGGQFGPAGSPSDSSSGAGLTPDRLTDALSGSRVLVSVFGGLRSPNQVRDVLKEAVKGILTDLLRVDVNSASRLADISTSFAVRLPIGSSSGEYVRPLVQQLYPRLQSFFAKPGASNLFFKLLLTGITNKAAQYGVMIPKDAADNDIVSLSANLGSIPSVPTSVGADISLGDTGGQYPDGGQFGPAGSPSDSSSGAGLTPDRLTDALSGSRVLVSVFGGLRSPNQVRDVLKEAVKGILTDLLRVDVNSASRLADISTSFAVRLPIGSSSGEYVRPLVQQLYPRLQSFFAKPGASNLFFKLLLTGITNKAAQYGVMIPKDAADNDIVSLSANLGSIPSVPTSVGADISLGDSGGQYPDGGQFGPAGSPSDSSSGAGLTPDRLTDALSGSRVLVSVFGGLRSPNQVRDVLKEAVKGILTDLLRVDVNSASRLADISTSFAVRLPIGSSSGEYVRPLVQQLYPRLQSFFAKPGASNLFFKLLLTGITNKAAQYGVMIPKDAADNDIVSLSANLGSIPSVPTSVGADISLGDSGGQYPDGGQFGPAGSPSDSSSGAGLTPDRLTDALSGSRVLVSVFGGLRSPNQVRDVLKEAVKGILTDLLRVDVNSASRLADISTSFAVRLPIGSSSGEYVRPLVQQLYPRLQSFFAKPGASNLFFKLLLTGITNKAAQYGVMIPKDAADNDIVSISANLGSIPSVPTSVGADISLGDSGGQYPDGGQFGPAGSPSDSSSGAGLTPDRLTDALSGSRVLVSVFGGLRSPNQVRDVLKEAVKGILTDLLRVDVNSASRLADISTSFAVRLPIGSSSGEYVRPLVQQLYPRLQSFFAKPGASNLFFKLLLTGITNKAAQYGVMIPKDAADNDIVSLSANLGSIPSVPTSVGADISLGDSGGQYPDGGQFGPAGSPSDSSSGAGLTPDRLTDALSGSRVLVSVFGGLRSPNQVRDVLKEAVKGILTDLLRVDVNSASRLADISTSFAVRLPIGSSSGEYVRPLVQQLYPRLQSFFAKPGASNLFFKLLLTGITNKAAQYGVMIPKDAADNDIVSISANLGSIPSVPTSVGADISLGDSGGQYPDGGQFGPAGSPSDSSSGAGLTPDRLTDALSGSRVLVSVFGGLRSPNQVRDVLKEAVKGILTDLLRVDVNSASRLADISTSFAVRLPIGSSSGEYVRPLVQQLYPRLQSFFAKPGASNLFFKLLLTGITNKAAQYGVMIPKDAADNDIVSISANLGSIPSVPTSVGADISLGDSGGQYPDGGQFGPAGSPSDSSSGAGLTPDRLTDALSGSRVLVSVFGGLRSPNQVRDVLKEAVKGILTDLLRVDVNSASRLADISTSFAVRLPIGSSSGEYVRPLVQQLYPRLQSFFAKPGASNLFFKLLLTGITNKAAQYGVMIPKDAADNDIVSLSANLGSIPSVPTSVGADISLGDSGGQYPDGGQFGPAGSPSDSSSGAGLTPDRLTDALSGSRVLVSVFGGLRSPNQVRDVLKEAVKGILTDLLRVDVNSASRLADISTSFAVRLPIGSSSGEYVRPLVQQLYPRLQSFFAKPGASNLFFKLLLTGITNKAAQYGVMIPKDAADNDIVSLSANLGSIPSVPTSVGADISLGDSGGQYPDGGQFGPAGSPSDSSSGAGLTPDRLTDALSGSRVLVSVFGGLRSPNQVRDVLKEAVKGILTDLLRVDVNSASRLADISTSFAVRLPIGSSSGEYVRPLVQQLYPRLQSFFAKPGASNLFFKLLLTGITNKAAQYGVMIPKDAADNDIVSLSANLGSIPSVPTSVGADISLGDSGGQYPDGGQFGPAGSPSDSSSGAGLTPDRLTDALSGSRVLVSVFGGLRSPNQVRDVLKEAVKGILTDLLRVDVNSASRLADISTSFAVRLPIGSSSGEYVRPLVQQLYPRLQSFFAKPGASNLFFKLLLTGITNKAAQYGVMIPKDAADNDIVSLSANLGSIPSVPTSVGADISLGDSGGQYPDGGQFGPAGSPSDSSSGAGLTPDRLTDALSGSRVLVSVFGGLRSPNQVRDVLKEAVKGILTDLLRVDVNSASRLADISTSFAVRLPIGSSSGEYVRPLVQQLYPRLQSFFAKPGASNLFFKLLLTGITNKAAQYGVMIPKDAADNDIVSLSANLGSIPSVPTSVGADISLGDSGGQYPDGGQFGPAGSPSDSSSGAGLTPDRLTDALSGSRVLVSVFGGLRSPNQVRDVLKEAVKGILTDLLRVDVNSASRLADISTSFAVRLPIGSSSGEYVRPLVQQLYPRLQSFFAKPGASNLFFKLLLTGITNKAAQYGVMIPKDAADNDIVSLSANLGSIPSVPTSVGADISLGDSGGQYPDGGQFGPAGSPSDSSSGAGLTPDRLTDALSGSRVLVSVFGGLRSPNQVRDVLKEAVKGILTDLLRVDVNSASRLADISTSFAVRLPIGSSSGEYVRPLVQQLYPRLQSFFAKPGASNLFFKLLLTGITNKAAQYGVMIPKDAADNDIVSLSANLGSIPSVPTSVGADISLGDSGGQYPDGGQFGPAGSPSDSSSGAGLTPDRLTDALSGSRVLVSVFGGLRSPNQVRDVLKEAVKGILTDLLRVDVNSASRLADISTSFAVRLPIGSSSGEYVRPLVQQLYPRLQSFFAKPGASNLFFKLLLTGITNKAAQYGVMIPKDAADNDIVSLSANLGSIPSVPTSVGADISLGDSGGQYPDGGQFGPAGSPSDSSSGAGLTPDRLTDALSGSRVLVSIFGGLRSPNQVRDVLKEAVKGILTDLLRVDVNSASRLADISTSFAVRLPIGSSSGEYVRPLVQQLYPRLQSFFAKPGASNLFFKLLLTGITNKAAQYGVMIPKDAADNDIVSLSANLGSIPSVPTSVGADISLGDTGGQYPDGGQFGPAGSPSDSSSGAGLTPDRLTDALSGSRVLVSVFGGLRSPNQVRDVLKEAVKGILTDLLRVDVNSASRLADISTSFAVRLPIGSSSGEYVRPLVQQLYPRLQSFFAKPGASNLFFKLLLTGITNKAAQYGVMIPKDAADNDIVSLSANLGSIPSVPTSVGADISLGDSGGQYPDGGQFGPAGSPSDSSSGAGLTPDRLTDALSGSRVLVSVFGGLRSPNQVRDVLKEAVKGILTDLLRVDVNSASRLADISTSFAVRLPIGSSSGEYVRPLVQQLYPRLQSFFAKPGASNLFFKLLLTGITNKAAQYGVMIPKDAADNDIVSLSANLGSIPSVPTSVGADISLGDSGGQYPDGGQFGPAGSPSDSSSGAGLTPDRLTDALSGSRVLVSVFGGLRSPNQVRDVLKEAVKGILTDLLRVDVNSASRLADISTSFAVRLPIGSSSGEYVRPLVQQLYPRLQSFFAKPGASNLFFKLLLTGITNKAAQYGVMIPKDAADNDIVSISANLGSIPSVPTSVGADISLGDTGGQYMDGGQYRDGGQFGASGGQYPDGGEVGTSGAADLNIAFNDILNSNNGLKSPQAGLRVKNLTSALKQAIRANGIDANLISATLRESFLKVKNSGMSSDKATIESLMELIAAFVNVLGSSSPDPTKSTALGSSIQTENGAALFNSMNSND